MRLILILIAMMGWLSTKGSAEVISNRGFHNLALAQDRDFNQLLALNQSAGQQRDRILASRPSLLPLTSAEVATFQKYVKDTNYRLTQMEKRGQILHKKINAEYEQTCLVFKPDSDKCDRVRAIYRQFIVNTIEYGGFYYKIRIYSDKVAELLAQ